MRLPILSLGFLLLVGCGSTSSSPPSSTARVTAIAPPPSSPSPTPDLYATAKAAYLAAATTSNDKLPAENAAIKSAKTPAQEQAAYKVLADDGTSFRLAFRDPMAA